MGRGWGVHLLYGIQVSVLILFLSPSVGSLRAESMPPSLSLQLALDVGLIIF